MAPSADCYATPWTPDEGAVDECDEAGNAAAAPAAPKRRSAPKEGGGRSGGKGKGTGDGDGKDRVRSKGDKPKVAGKPNGSHKEKDKKLPAACAGVFDWKAELEDLSARITMLRDHQQRVSREQRDTPPLVALLSGIDAAFGDYAAAPPGQDGGGGGGGGAAVHKDAATLGITAAVARACQVANAIVVEAEPAPEQRARANHVLAGLYYVQQALSVSSVAARVLTSDVGAAASICDEDLAAGVARFSAPDPEDANRMQQLLLYLLNTSQSRGYRRSHGAMYERILIDECDTHAWRRVCEMRDFVYEVTRKEINYDMWLNLTAVRGNIAAAADHLCACHDVQLPDLRKDRHVFAFTNGIYLAATDRFVRYGTPEHATLPIDLVAAKFFEALMPIEFDGEADGDSGNSDGNSDGDGDGDSDGDTRGRKKTVRRAKEHKEECYWYDAIETPHLQGIMDYQVSFSLGRRTGASPARKPKQNLNQNAGCPWGGA